MCVCVGGGISRKDLLTGLKEVPRAMEKPGHGDGGEGNKRARRERRGEGGGGILVCHFA